MTIERMDHVGIVVDDLPAAIEFFLALGMELQGEGSGEGDLVDRIVASRASARTSPSSRPRTGRGKSSW